MIETRYDFDIVERLIINILLRIGLPTDEAELMANALITADARGMQSHGVMRLPTYVNRIRAGGMKYGMKGKIIQETQGTILLDGEDGIGHVIVDNAMQLAIAKAKTNGVGVVAVTHSNHFGEAAYYILKAVRQNMIGLMGTNGSPNMPVWGGTTKMTGPHALAMGVPAGNEFPIILDMSLGVVSKGKIILADKRGEKIPLGWGVDSLGNPTEDPAKVLKGGWTLPIGGYKGWGLILFFEILSGVLTGGRIATDITDLYGDPAISQGLGHFVLALDVEAFIPIGEFKKRIDEYIRLIKSSEIAPGFDEIMLPGEREFRLESIRRNNGIPITTEVFSQLKSLAIEVGSEFNLTPILI